MTAECSPFCKLVFQTLFLCGDRDRRQRGDRRCVEETVLPLARATFCICARIIIGQRACATRSAERGRPGKSVVQVVAMALPLHPEFKHLRIRWSVHLMAHWSDQGAKDCARRAKCPHVPAGKLELFVNRSSKVLENSLRPLLCCSSTGLLPNSPKITCTSSNF